MATESFLWKHEESIIALRDALKVEIGMNTDTGTVNARNRDSWGTIMVNARVLANEIEKVLQNKVVTR
jgi:hypothetical protein